MRHEKCLTIIHEVTCGNSVTAKCLLKWNITRVVSLTYFLHKASLIQCNSNAENNIIEIIANGKPEKYFVIMHKVTYDNYLTVRYLLKPNTARAYLLTYLLACLLACLSACLPAWLLACFLPSLLTYLLTYLLT